MGSFWDKQPGSLLSCVSLCTSTDTDTTMFLSALRWEEKDERHSVLFGRWQISYTQLVHAFTNMQESHADTHSKQMCLKSDRSLALSLHSSRLSFYCFSSVTSQRLKCVHASKHTHTHTHTHEACTVPSRKDYFNTTSVNTQQTAFLVLKRLQEKALMNAYIVMMDKRIRAFIRSNFSIWNFQLRLL